MADRDRFELDLAAALQTYLDEAPTEVRPTELARHFATDYPPGRTSISLRRFAAIPRPAWVLLLGAALLAALVGGALLAGSRLLERTPPLPARLPALLERTPPLPARLPALLEGMVTEEVEPGVLRIVNDGVRDLTYPRGPDSGEYTVDVTPDGSVWLSGDDWRPAGLVRTLFALGQEPTFEDRGNLEVAPDGSLWAIPGGYFILSLDGEGWTVRATQTDASGAVGLDGRSDGSLNFETLAIGPDGTVWVAASDRDKYCSDHGEDDCVGTVLMRLEDDGSLTDIEGWADVYDGHVSPDELAVSPAGDVWLVGSNLTPGRPWGAEVVALLRFDGEAWELVPGPEGLYNQPGGRSLDIGPDGTLWMNASGINPDGTLWMNGGRPDSGRLARFDDSGWTVFTEADGVEPWGGQGWIETDLLTVAPDGSVWMNGNGPDDCNGVAHYDGTTWTSYLCGSYVDDLAIAPDGSVWLRAHVASGVPTEDVHYTYVIRPETAATTE